MNVHIKYVNFPRPGGKYGSIKTADGTSIMVPPDLLGLFRAGMTCDVPVKYQTWGEGDMARQVTVATGGPQAAGTIPGSPYPANQGYGGVQQGGAPVPRETLYGARTAFQPRVVQGGGSAALSARDKTTDRMIFVTGVVGRAMGSGKFSASEIAMLTEAASQAFELFTAPKVVQQAYRPPPSGDDPNELPPDIPDAG